MPDNLVLIFDGVGHFEVSFENLGEEHLDCPYHASPPVIRLDIFYSFAVCQPEGSSKNEQEFIGFIETVADSQQLRIGSFFFQFYFLSGADVGMFDWVYQIGFQLPYFADGGREGGIEGLREVVELIFFLEVGHGDEGQQVKEITDHTLLRMHWKYYRL